MIVRYSTSERWLEVVRRRRNLSVHSYLQQATSKYCTAMTCADLASFHALSIYCESFYLSSFTWGGIDPIVCALNWHPCCRHRQYVLESLNKISVALRDLSSTIALPHQCTVSLSVPADPIHYSIRFPLVLLQYSICVTSSCSIVSFWSAWILATLAQYLFPVSCPTLSF